MHLPPERWRKIDSLLAEALERPEDHRAAYLDARCEGDDELRQEVLRLLRSEPELESFLDRSVESVAAPLLAAESSSESLAGLRIGPYRIIREIGRGGMGQVLLAERVEGGFEKLVALKLVKRGMDSDEILRRFEVERQILASLEHPNVARLYDGGASADGRPYLVMELVDGEPITTYCDRRRLTVRQRLSLFRSVCAALQYAHQKLVVHRDVKPSNVLVTGDGTAKLVDFGIAKLLGEEDATPQTRTGLRVLTPEYAAPEQLRGEPVTVASDVYGLGAVLYELLSGRRPRHSGDLTEAVLQRDPEWEPDRLSAWLSRKGARANVEVASGAAAARGTTPERLRRQLEGDLDTIVLKALAAVPARRYQSAQQLLDDIDRFLGGRPVEARAPGRAYRAGKFARRHRVGLVAASLVTISLVGALATSLRTTAETALQRDIAESERRVAELERDRAGQIATFLVDLFGAADPLSDDADRTDTLRVRDLLDRGAARVRLDLGDQPRLRAQMLTVLGRVYTNLGLFEPAEELLLEAAHLPLGPDAPLELSTQPLALLGQIQNQRNDHIRADSLYRALFHLYDAAGAAPDSFYIANLSEYAVVMAYGGDRQGADTLHARALDLARLAGSPGDALEARVVNNRAMLHFDLGEFAEAEELFRRTLDIERATLRPDHPRLAVTLNNLGASIQYQGRHEEAEPVYRESIDIGRRALGDRHPELPNYIQNLATLYDDQGRFDEAEPLYREAITVYGELFGENSPRTALIVRNYGLNRLSAGDPEAAEALLRRAHGSFLYELGTEHLYTALAATALGRVLLARDAAAEARRLLQDGIPILLDQLPGEHFLVAMAHADLGAALAATGEYSRAEPLLVSSYQSLLESMGPAHYGTVGARDHLRSMFLALGLADRAAAYETAPR